MKSKLTAILLGLTLAVGSFSAPAIAASKARAYPLKACLVTDSQLGSMGRPVTKTYDGQEIRFCCKPCVKKFEANPANYLAKLR